MLAKAVFQSTFLLTDMPPSRASFAPTGTVFFMLARRNLFERSVWVKVQMDVSPFTGLFEEAVMQKWKITFVDDHGETANEVFECDECPDNEHAAKLIKERLLPVVAELDLNDLEGRTADASVKNLKAQNSIQILGITPV
ncbi:hypothetical protein PMI32_01812 [Pseudomonas sp. GM60]|nr:hypothetical protein PMI32_01812 [Pseudomonas sp. GM60]